MHCALCGRRRGRRDCPALGERICPLCCGRKRLVEIDCPPDCSWLSRAEGSAWEGRQSEQRTDSRRLLPTLQELGRSQAALLVHVTSGLVRLRREQRDLDDVSVLEALEALLKTAETVRSGILYEHRPEALRAQALMSRLRPLLEPPGPDGDPVPVPVDDQLAVLRGLVEALRATRAEQQGASAFLDTLTRFEARRLRDSAQRASSRLILPS
jgi:hypothetical protein